MLRILNLKAVKAGLLHSLAEKEYYPDFDIGVSYGQRDDSGAVNRPDFFSAGVSINIPLWHRNKEGRKVAEEKAGIDAALQQYEAMRNDLIFQIARLSAEIRQLEREAELFKTGLIPQSSISYETILSDYKLSKAGFLAIIKSQIERSDYELEHYRLQVDREKKLAELEAVVGQKLY
ncbi:TolC family protein [bacterium]|nr:TolC family protein [bacterium]